jgi:hypothetical protein
LAMVSSVKIINSRRCYVRAKVLSLNSDDGCQSEYLLTSEYGQLLPV